MDDIKALDGDDGVNIEQQNAKLLAAFITGDAEALKLKIKNLQNEFVTVRRENDASLAAKDQELATSHELNSKLRDDYEILEERFKKHSKMNDDFVTELKVDIKKTHDVNKELQEFKDKFDVVLQDERSDKQKMLIKLNEEREEMERNLKKQLDTTKRELEELQGEFQVKMMKIKLMELEVENKLIDIQESQDGKEKQLKLAQKQCKELKTAADKSEQRADQFKEKCGKLEKERDDIKGENANLSNKLN